MQSVGFQAEVLAERMLLRQLQFDFARTLHVLTLLIEVSVLRAGVLDVMWTAPPTGPKSVQLSG